MRFCKQCGKHVKDDVKFCPKCGIETSELEVDNNTAADKAMQGVETARQGLEAARKAVQNLDTAEAQAKAKEAAEKGKSFWNGLSDKAKKIVAVVAVVIIAFVGYNVYSGTDDAQLKAVGNTIGDLSLKPWQEMRGYTDEEIQKIADIDEPSARNNDVKVLRQLAQRMDKAFMKAQNGTNNQAMSIKAMNSVAKDMTYEVKNTQVKGSSGSVTVEYQYHKTPVATIEFDCRHDEKAGAWYVTDIDHINGLEKAIAEQARGL